MQDNQDSGHFSQEELDAIVSGTVTPKMPVDLGTPQEQSPEKPIWDTADVALSVPRGVVGFGKSIYNLADTVSFDLLPDWHTNPLGSSQSHVGGLVEGLSQFVSGFATGGLALRGASMIPGAVGKAAAWLGGAGGGAAAVVRGGMVKGGIADFISFEGAEGRLSDILVEFDNPVLNNTVTQYLASDMDDSELEGRLKNVLEGAVLGVALEGIVAGVKGSAKAIRKYRQAKAAGVPEEDAVRAAMEVAGDDLEQASRMLEEPETKVQPDVSEPTASRLDRGMDDPTVQEAQGSANLSPRQVERIAQTSEEIRSWVDKNWGRPIERTNSTEMVKELKSAPGVRSQQFGQLAETLNNIIVEATGNAGGAPVNIMGHTTNMPYLGLVFNDLPEVFVKPRFAPGDGAVFTHELMHVATSMKLRRIYDDRVSAISSRLGGDSSRISPFLYEDKSAGAERMTQEYIDSLKLWIDDTETPESIRELFASYIDVVEHRTDESWRKMLEDQYGMRTIHEFLAEAISNRQFQELLRSIPTKGRGQSVYTKLVEALRKFLGISESERTMLTDVIQLAEEIASGSDIPIRRMASSSADGTRLATGSGGFSRFRTHDTPEFRQQMSGTHVVDESGNPLGVFHGTPNSGFDEFSVEGYGSFGTGGYFTKLPNTAGKYAEPYGVARMTGRVFGDYGEGSGIYPVFLSIKNPLYWDRPIDVQTWRSLGIVSENGIQGRFTSGMTNGEAYETLGRELHRIETATTGTSSIESRRNLRHQALVDAGFDGVIVEKTPNERPGDVWYIAWKKNQIKSVFNERPTQAPGIMASPSPGSMSASGGPNYGVEETRRVNVPEATAASVRELEDLINTGAGADVIAARIEQLREQGIINLRPVIQSGTPGAYAEALVALRQVEANEGRFGPTARRSNAENTRAGMAQLQAAMESGGLNVPEVMKAIQDGVATIKDFNERLPFFLGLEAAFRYEAVQALRSGRGDTDEVMRAFTMVSGSTRRIKSYLGKNLQMIQAFGDMDVVRRSWESLDPRQRRVLMNQYADTLEMLVVDPQTGKEMAKVLTEGMVTKGGRIGAELFRNSILSGPKTLAVNIWSAVEALALPMERGLGRLGAGQRDQALREFGTLARYSSEAKDALTAFKTSFMEEGDSVALGRGNTQFGDLQPSRAIASRNFAKLNSVDPTTGGVRRTIAGLAVDFVGQVVNMPMRAMGSSDEFFTTMMARAEADVVLRRIVSQERKLPMTSSAVSLEVERLKKLLFVDGQLYTRRTVVERGMRLARDKHLPESFRETLTDSVAARMELDRNDPAVVSEVSRLFNQAVSNNKVKPASELRKSKDATVLIQSLDAAGQRARANPMFIPEVQRYVDQNWDAYADSDYMQAGLGKNLQQQTGQDYRLLQKASAEVERRVREATWKREYDDMAESSVLGTQLVGNIGKATASAVSHVPLLQLVVPFIRTPTNLLAFVTDRNPVGRAYSWWQAAKAGDKEAAAEAAGRLATGTVLYTTGIVLAANGMITGRGPKDPDLRKQLLASGWQPYSFRLGDTYLSYGRNDPISTFLGLVADTYEIAANTYDPTPEDQDALMKVATAVVGSVANNVTNKSYLRGIVTTLGALTGDEAEWQKLQRQYAGALVPNFLAQVDQTTLDPDIREVRSMMDAIRSRVPVFGETVDRLRNPLGEPIKGNETAFSIFLPGTASTRTKDPVKRELADSLISVGSPRSTLPGGIDLRSIKLKNGQSAYDRLQELTGQVKVGGKTVRDQLAALIQSPFYKELPALGQDDISSPRVSLVRGYVGNYRKAAMQQLLKESPELARAVAHSRELKASMLR